MTQKIQFKKPKKVSDCLKIHFQVLAWVGFYRPMVYYKNRMTRILLKVYRNFVMVLMVSYNFQHAIFALQSLDEMDNLIAASLILLTTINNICKMVILYKNTDRLKTIMEVIDGPHFAPLDKIDEEIIENNSNVMSFLLKPCHSSVILCCTMWCIAPFINRAKGIDVVIPGYYPFNTNSSAGFSFMVLYENIVMAWVGIGHTTIDVIIASFYILIKAQLQIMRHHLERIADPDEVDLPRTKVYDLQKYKDQNDFYCKRLQERFVFNVVKYEKIYWLMNEVQSIFNNAIVVQLLVSACILCVVVYKMVQLASVSFDFFYLFQYGFSLGMQLFLYCYFGTQAEYESMFVNDSLYASDWTSLTPRFRKQMSIAMSRWTRHLKPCAAYIIPLSLTTFIGVLRLSYSLYTILKKTSD